MGVLEKGIEGRGLAKKSQKKSYSNPKNKDKTILS